VAEDHVAGVGQLGIGALLVLVISCLDDSPSTVIVFSSGPDLSRLAGRYLGPADPLLPGTGGCRRPVLAPRAGGL
jgi:hypothetical protein